MFDGLQLPRLARSLPRSAGSKELDAVFAGRQDTVLQYRRAAGALRTIQRMGFTGALGWVILGLRIYPSMNYVARRP